MEKEAVFSCRNLGEKVVTGKGYPDLITRSPVGHTAEDGTAGVCPRGSGSSWGRDSGHGALWESGHGPRGAYAIREGAEVALAGHGGGRLDHSGEGARVVEVDEDGPE